MALQVVLQSIVIRVHGFFRFIHIQSKSLFIIPLKQSGINVINHNAILGTHLVEAPTWRPCGNDTAQQMRRFFTGGAPELEDIEYVKIPPESEVGTTCFFPCSVMLKIRSDFLITWNF